MAIIKAIQDEKLKNTEFDRLKWFQLSFPKHCEGLSIDLDPRKSWDNQVDRFLILFELNFF